MSETVVPETGGNTQDTNLQWLKRDIMVKCVMNFVRQWFPNVAGIPYMGHMWEL